MNPTGGSNNRGHQRPPPSGSGPGPPFGQQPAGGMPPHINMQQTNNNNMANNFAAGGGFSFGAMPTPPPPGGIGMNSSLGAPMGQQQQQQQQHANSGMPFPFDMSMMPAAGQQLLNNNNDGMSDNNSSHGSQQAQQQQTALFQQMQQNQQMLQMMQQAQQAAMMGADNIVMPPNNNMAVDPTMMMQQMMGMMAASAQNNNTGGGGNGMGMAPNNALPFSMPMMMMTNHHSGGGGGIVRQNTPRPPQYSQQQQQLQQIQPKPTAAAQKRSLVPLAPAPDVAPATPAKASTSSSSLSSSKKKANAKKAAATPSSSTSSGASGGRKRKASRTSDSKAEASSDGDASFSNSADGTSAFASLASRADEASAFHSSAAAGNSTASNTNDGNATTSSSYSSAGLSISSSVQPSLPPEHAQRLLPPTLLGAGHTGFAGIGDAAKTSGRGGGSSSGRVLLSAKEQLAAAAAAADAIVLAETAKGGADGASTARGAEGGPAKRGRRPGGNGQPLTAEEKAQLHRDRNREHARSTRLRKKAYVNKLKELVDTLRTERSEEAKRRRVAVQHLAEVQRVRRAVVNTFLKYHTAYESDRRKWATIIEEDGFVFKQPVTPYRYFRRSEIDKECRIASDIDSLINDGASMSVMIESIGSRSPRWMQIKREDFLTREEARNGGATSERRMPHSIVRQNSRLQHAVSSLSSSSGSSSGNGSGAEEDARRARAQSSRRGDSKGSNAAASSLSSSDIKAGGMKRQLPPTSTGAKKVSSSSSGGGSGSHDSQGSRNPSSSGQSSNYFHEYNAPDLPDPMLDTNSTGSDSPTGSGDDAALPVTKRPFSGNGEDGDTKPSATKRYKASPSPTDREEGSGSGVNKSGTKSQVSRSRLPPNIAKTGGIAHDIKPMALEEHDKPGNNPRLNSAPAIPLPPFTGLGKRSAIPVAATTVGAVIVNKTPSALGSSGGENNSGSGSGSSGNEADNENDTTGAPKVGVSTDSGSAADSTSSSSVTGGPAARSYQGSAAATEAAVIGDNTSSSSQSGSQSPEITCTYHVNEDDMLLTDDVLMCPFVFRSRDAVVCGALAECVQPGMLRAQFSPRNKLVSFELVFDAMGFMQQLERASGSEGSAQIVPNSLEMALSPNTEEARVITMAEPPFMIVSVNEAWTRMTKYTQMEAEGKDMTMLNGKRTDPKAGARSGKPPHDFAEVAKGRSACSVNCHYDKHGGDFIDFVSSYPLTNADDKVTHLLHVCRKLPVPVRPGDIEFGSVTFRELDTTTTSNTDNAALTQ